MSLTGLISVLKESNPSSLLSFLRPGLIRAAVKSKLSTAEKINLLSHADDRKKVAAVLNQLSNCHPLATSYIKSVAASVETMNDVTYAKLALCFALDIFQSDKQFDQKKELVLMIRKFAPVLSRDIVANLANLHVAEFADAYNANGGKLHGLDALQEGSGQKLSTKAAVATVRAVSLPVVQQNTVVKSSVTKSFIEKHWKDALMVVQFALIVKMCMSPQIIFVMSL